MIHYGHINIFCKKKLSLRDLHTHVHQRHEYWVRPTCGPPSATMFQQLSSVGRISAGIKLMMIIAHDLTIYHICIRSKIPTLHIIWNLTWGSNFHPLEAADRVSETQFQVDENLNSAFEFRLTHWNHSSSLAWLWQAGQPGSVFSYKLRYIVGFGLVEMAISTNPKPTIYRNLHENTRPDFRLGTFCPARGMVCYSVADPDGGWRGLHNCLCHWQMELQAAKNSPKGRVLSTVNRRKGL